MLFQPNYPNFGWSYTNVPDRAPAVNVSLGTSVMVLDAGPGGSFATPSVGTNTLQLATTAQVAYDVYGIQLCFNNYAAAGNLRNAKARIMTGTTDSGPDAIPGSIIINDLLLGACAPHQIDFGGIWYYFPLFIPAGTSLWIQIIGGTARTESTGPGVAMWLFGKPKYPEVTRVGRYVDTYGITVRSIDGWLLGTDITLGAGSEGNFTQIGSATTRPYWWAQLGFSYLDSSTTNAALHLELAAGTSTTVNRLLIYDQLWITNTSEQVTCRPYYGGMTGFDVPTGSNIYGRGQTSGVSDTTPTIAAYMLGG